MQKHVNLVAYLHISYGILILLAALVTFISIAGGGMLANDSETSFFTTGVSLTVSIFLVLLAFPSIIGGAGLLKRRPWARVLVMVLSFLDLLSFPFGTAIGVYSLWTLNRSEVREMFQQSPTYHT